MTATTQNRVGVDITFTQTPTSGSGTVTDVRNLIFSPGTVIERSDGRRFQWVLAEDANVAAGELLCYTTDDNRYEVTNDRSGGTSDNEQAAGLAVNAITDGDFGWIQVYGLNLSAITTDGGVTNGEALIPHASTDGGADSATASSADAPGDQFGYALADDTSTTLAASEVFLDCVASKGSGGA